MKGSFIAFICSLLSTPAFANPILLQCEFYKQSNLQGFTMILDEEKVVLSFKGQPSKENMNPAGEKLTLIRRRPISENWMHYRGEIHFAKNSPEACNHNDFADRCDAKARGFDLSFSRNSLTTTGDRSGSLSFTRVSLYLPAESFYSHSIFCSVLN